MSTGAEKIIRESVCESRNAVVNGRVVHLPSWSDSTLFVSTGETHTVVAGDGPSHADQRRG